MKRRFIALFAAAATVGTVLGQVTSGPGTFQNLTTLSGSTYIDVTQFGADSTFAADSTAALQAALDYAYYTNGAAKIVLLRNGAYKITDTLNYHHSTLSAPSLVGEGALDFLALTNDASLARTKIVMVTPNKDGIRFLGDPVTSRNLLRAHFADFAILGPTNTTGAGIRIGYSGGAGYGGVQLASFERVASSWWRAGYQLDDTVSTSMKQCSGMYNAINSICCSNRADSISIENCWLGWSTNNAPTSTDTQTALWFDSSVWGSVKESEVGNCKRALYMNGGLLNWTANNIESMYVLGGEAMFLTNLSFLTVTGGRYAKTSGQAVPLVRVRCAAAGQQTSPVQINNIIWDGSTNMVAVEGNYIDLPKVMLNSNPGGTWHLMEVHNTIGGAISFTSDYSLADVNVAQEWRQPQVFRGSSQSALTVQNGYLYGSVFVAADEGTNTLTANQIKSGLFCMPQYSGTAYQVGFLHPRAYSGVNELGIGGDAAQNNFGCTTIAFRTAATTSAVASERARMYPDGGMQFLGAVSNNAATYANGLVTATSSLATLASNKASLLSSNVATGTWNWTNSLTQDAVVYVTGGTVSGIGHNGTLVASAAGPYTFVVQPGEWLGVTNSVAPLFKFKPF